MLNMTVQVTGKTRSTTGTENAIGGWSTTSNTFDLSMPCHIVPMTGEELEWAAQRGIYADSAMYFDTSGVNEDHVVTDTGLTKTYDIRFVGLHRGGALAIYKAYMEERAHRATT